MILRTRSRRETVKTARSFFGASDGRNGRHERSEFVAGSQHNLESSQLSCDRSGVDYNGKRLIGSAIMRSCSERERGLSSILDLPQKVKRGDAFIKCVIIPEMDRRRGRNAPLSSAAVLQKLHAPENSDKPGEGPEFARALRESGSRFTPDLALEIADLVYYYNQPNALTRQSLNALLFLILGDQWKKLSDDFCMVKYATRIQYGNRHDYKEIEDRMMRFHLRRLARTDSYFSQD